MLFSRRHPIRDNELNAYVDGELVAVARARVEAHLKRCAACRETVSSLRSLRGALGALPRAERDRSFVIREADIALRATPRLATGYPLAARLLSGVTVMAVLAFAALVSLDASGGRSKEAAGLASSFQPSAQDSASAPDAPNGRVGGDNTAEYLDQQPPSLPATGPLPEATSPSIGQTLPSSTAPAFEGNPSTEAPPPAEVTKTLDGLTVETPPAYDRSGQFILPRVVPTTAQKGLGVEAAGGSDTGLRAGEAAAAAVALMAGGSLAFVWWRRRSV